jgi:hypothetical protein
MRRSAVRFRSRAPEKTCSGTLSRVRASRPAPLHSAPIAPPEALTHPIRRPPIRLRRRIGIQPESDARVAVADPHLSDLHVHPFGNQRRHSSEDRGNAAPPARPPPLPAARPGGASAAVRPRRSSTNANSSIGQSGAEGPTGGLRPWSHRRPLEVQLELHCLYEPFDRCHAPYGQSKVPWPRRPTRNCSSASMGIRRLLPMRTDSNVPVSIKS